MKLKSYDTTNLNITTDHFGGNAVYSKNTDAGDPNENFVEAVNGLDIKTLRYPAGEAETELSIVEMPNGQLSDDVVTFLDWASANNIKVTLVIKTNDIPFSKGATPTSAQANAIKAYSDKIADFTETVLEKYGDTINSFEIGNEYWGAGPNGKGMDEYSYGKRADIAAQALEDGINNAYGNMDPDIIVQMANPVGAGSAFGSGSGGSFVNRVKEANQAIIDQLSNDAKSAIDGVVEHYYYKLEHSNDPSFQDTSAENNYIDVKYGMWDAAFSKELDLHITEWNVKSNNPEQMGMKSASVVIEQFENMIEMGVDSTFAWPVQHNTTNDLAGGLKNDPILNPEKIITNSVAGAVFDLMSSSLIGTKLVTTDFSNDDGSIEINTYKSADKVVIYVSSRSSKKEALNIDLTKLIDGYTSVSAVQVGYDKSSSDGKFWAAKNGGLVSADYVMVDGKKYYLNEHDVKAEITQLSEQDLGQGNSPSLELDPYEVVELTYYVTESVVVNPPVGNGLKVYGTDGKDELIGDGKDKIFYAKQGDDLIIGGNGNEYIDTGNGFDTVKGGNGNDTILGGLVKDDLYGGDGNDKIMGEKGKDVIVGNDGNDFIYGGFGHDIISGGTGNDYIDTGNGKDNVKGGDGNDHIIGGNVKDTLSGGKGLDTIDGGNGQDKIYGNSGNDILSGNSGNDTIYGGHGNDHIIAGSGLDTVYGGAGDDIIEGGSIKDKLIGGVGDDTIYGHEGKDILIGRSGDDTLNGGEGADIYFGGEGEDVFVFNETGTTWGEKIKDFDPTQDKLLIDIDNVNDISDLKIFETGDGYTINFSKVGEDGSIHIDGDYTWAQLAEEDNFIFM